MDDVYQFYSAYSSLTAIHGEEVGHKYRQAAEQKQFIGPNKLSMTFEDVDYVKIAEVNPNTKTLQTFNPSSPASAVSGTPITRPIISTSDHSLNCTEFKFSFPARNSANTVSCSVCNGEESYTTACAKVGVREISHKYYRFQMEAAQSTLVLGIIGEIDHELVLGNLVLQHDEKKPEEIKIICPNGLNACFFMEVSEVYNEALALLPLQEVKATDDFKVDQQYHHDRLHKRICGLMNVGNTCFMNSTLQSLVHTEPLRNHYLAENVKEGELTNEYVAFLQSMWNSTAASINPLNLKASIAKIAPRFAGYNQEDAQELLISILTGLHDEQNLVTEKPYVDMTVQHTDELPFLYSELANEWWKKYLLRENSEIVNIFHGQLVTETECENGHKDITFEAFSQLTLSIPEDKQHDNCSQTQNKQNRKKKSNQNRYCPIQMQGRISKLETKKSFLMLEDCLNLFFSQKKTSWFCQKCRMIVTASIKTSLWKLGKILIIYFKRFTQEGYRYQKITERVDFQQRLMLKEYTQNHAEQEAFFELYAVVNHNGALTSGHYWAYIKHEEKWYCCDDMEVKQINSRSIVTNNAYILFYQQRNDHYSVSSPACQ